MLDFISGCAGLFNHIFSAACELDFFRFLVLFLFLEVFLAVFLMLYYGTRKM